MGDRNHRESSLAADWLRKLPHYLYVADLIAGKQVLEVGCGSGEGARFLADHGAARVVGLDVRSGKVEQARRRYSAANLTFRHEDPASTELRDHSFDCVFVPDGAALVKRPAVLRELRRVLVPGGHLFLVSASADRDPEAPGLTFHEIKDVLEPLFAPVRMVAQAPLVAMSLVEYAEGGSEQVAFDTSLVEWTRAPEGVVTDYLAICGGVVEGARGFTLVQLPLRPGVDVVERSLIGDGHLLTAAGAEGAAVAGGNGTLAGTVTAQIAGALQAHAELTRELERTLAEQQLYSDELREELEQTLERSDTAERARKTLTEKLEAMQEELKSWRSRAAQAEGEVMRLRLGRGEEPVGAVEGAGEPGASAHERELAAVRAELADTRQRLERVAVHWKEAEARAETVVRRVSELEAQAHAQQTHTTERLAEARQQFDAELVQAREEERSKQAGLEAELRASQERARSLAAELEQLRAARAELEGRVEAAEAARAELERKATEAVAAEPVKPEAPKRKARPRKKATKAAAAGGDTLPGLDTEAPGAPTADESSEPDAGA
jgi:hypothetical protein